MEMRLVRYGFSQLQSGDFYLSVEGVEIKWNIEHEHGAYLIDGEITLINSLEELDDLIEQLDLE